MLPLFKLHSLISFLSHNRRYGTDAFGVDVIEAAKKANAHGFVTGLTDGYDTLVGERYFHLDEGPVFWGWVKYFYSFLFNKSVIKVQI